MWFSVTHIRDHVAYCGIIEADSLIDACDRFERAFGVRPKTHDDGDANTAIIVDHPWPTVEDASGEWRGAVPYWIAPSGEIVDFTRAYCYVRSAFLPGYRKTFRGGLSFDYWLSRPHTFELSRADTEAPAEQSA